MGLRRINTIAIINNTIRIYGGRYIDRNSNIIDIVS